MTVNEAIKMCRTISESSHKLPCDDCRNAHKFFAELFEKQKWVDVNDKLPERDGETVLCYVKNSSTDGETYVTGCIQQRKHWFLQTCNIGVAEFPNHYWTVTHWMPLPEPPKERTLDNCSLFREVGSKPPQSGGKCIGFAKGEYDDEPCEQCKECKFNVFYEE